MPITSSLNSNVSSEGTQMRLPSQKTNTTGNSPFAAIMQSQGVTNNAISAPGMQNSAAATKVALSMNNAASNNTLLQQAGVHTERLNVAQQNKQQLQLLDSLSQNMGKSDSLLDVARNDVGMKNMQNVMSGSKLSTPIVPMANSIKAQALAMQHKRDDKDVPDMSRRKFTVPMTIDGALGSLSKRFESGKDGIAAIGYDRTGGTSYGSYQIASKVGSMENFLKMAQREDPDIAKMLREAGPANTGSRHGAMPDAWRKLAKEEPERLDALQKKFIHETHYAPAARKIEERTDIDTKNLSSATQEVLFSTAVQHGPSGAARIFSRAAAAAGDVNDKDFEKNLIDRVYDIRKGQFGTSTPSVQAAARNRMVAEKDLALNMLQQNSLA